MPQARENSIEITAEDAAAIAELSSTSQGTSHSNSIRSNSNSSSVAKRFTKLIKPMSKNLHLRSSPKHNTRTSMASSDHATAGSLSARQLASDRHEQDNSSFNSESIGQMSVTPTVASLDTVKISNQNRQAQQDLEDAKFGHKSNKKTPWKKLKQFMGLPPSKASEREQYIDEDAPFPPSSASSVATAPFALRKSHSKSLDFPSKDAIPFTRRRVASMDFPKHGYAMPMSKIEEQHVIDDALRGRLDGLDVLYLGPAFQISLPRQTSSKTESSTPWEPAPGFSFAGRTTQYTTRQIVTDMMWSSAGQDLPEIVLEGFFRDDRWIVSLDISRRSSLRNSRNNTAFLIDLIDDHPEGRHSPEPLPTLQSTDEEDHSHSTATDEIPRHKLWSSMWGADQKPPPKPSHMTSAEDTDRPENVLEMAASCSVPIDVDEDTFMISNAQHLQAVHEIASVPLQHGHFEDAYRIFERILRGIQIQDNDALRHLEGVTLHNMSVIAMWKGNFTQAQECIGKAINARRQYLPENHPDIAVSLVRQGYAYFALENFDLSIASFEAALELVSEDNVARAKILNNLGVANYQRGDDIGALKNFSDALQVQRVWCQGPIRRMAHVFGAAVMLGNMGKIHIKRGDYDLALSVYEEALVLQTSMFPKDHDVVLASLISVALAWAFNSQPQKSGQILNGVLRSQLGRFGPGTPAVVETTGTVGNLHFGLGNYEDALKCFAPVLKWQKAHLKPEHPSLKKTKDIMKRLKKSISAIWV